VDFKTTKTNINKGIAKARRQEKRLEAEDRNEAYQKLSLEEKLTHHPKDGKAAKKLLAQEAS